MKILRYFFLLNSVLFFQIANAESISNFIEIDPYVAGSPQMTCASYSDDEWRVDLKDEKLTVGKPTRIDKHVLEVAGGKIIGADGGEWAGSLEFVQGKKIEKMPFRDNILALYKVSDERVIAMTGMAHMSSNRGALVSYGRKSNLDKWKIENRVQLPGAPHASARTDSNTILFVSNNGVYEVSIDTGKVTTLKEIPTLFHYANSIVRNAKGEIYVGMRFSIARLTPTKNGYDPKWLIKAHCKIKDSYL